MSSRPNLYDPAIYQASLERIHALTPDSRPLWGKMDVAGMLFHLSRTQDLTGGAPIRLGWFRRAFLALVRPFLRRLGLGSQPYRRGLPTHPSFVPRSGRDFDEEKARLLASLEAFRASDSEAASQHPVFGRLTGEERGYLSWRHMNHHLEQFGV